jgi:hypothetical protein
LGKIQRMDSSPELDDHRQSLVELNVMTIVTVLKFECNDHR